MIENNNYSFCSCETSIITVIVAIRNGAKTIQRCLDSVAKQTYPNKQLIVIDANSTDGTVELLKANSDKIDYWISEPDSGIYNAFNKALDHSRGEWIYFLGADDFLWNESVLEKFSKFLVATDPSTRIIYGQVAVVSATGNVLDYYGVPWEDIKSRFLQIMCIPHQGVMHHCSLYKDYGNFNESFRYAGDYEFMLRELKTANALFVPQLVVCGMQHGGVSSEVINSVALLKEIRKAQKLHNLNFTGFVWVIAILKAYLRVALHKLCGERYSRIMYDFLRQLAGRNKYWTLQ